MIKKILSILSIWVGSLIALLIVVILSFLLFLAGLRVDVLYDVALFIPGKLGLTADVSLDEITLLHGGQTKDVFLRKGRYRIYSDEFLGRLTKISIISQETAQITEITSLYENNPDVRFKLGVPQFVFKLDMDGYYRVETNTINGDALPESVTYWIKPYVGNQNAAGAIFSGLIQIGIVVLCFRIVSRYFKKDEMAALEEVQAENREQWDWFLDEIKKGKR